MEVIELAGYTLHDKSYIAKRYLIPRRIEASGLKKQNIKFTDDAIERIIESYTSEAGVRNLEREIGSVCRALAAQVAEKKKIKKTVTPEIVEEVLGPIKYEPELALRTSSPGVVTGLAWTPFGGEILFVEASAMKVKLGAAVPALFGAVLVYLDQNITARLINNKDNKLTRGGGYHIDLAIVGVLTAAFSLFGLPWLVAATVRSLNHLRSLATTEESIGADGAAKTSIVKVRETRVSGFAIHVLIGCSLLALDLLKFIPTAVLYGLFLYMRPRPASLTPCTRE